MKTVFISDTHVGSKMSNFKGLIEFLSRRDFDSLVIVGDGQQHSVYNEDIIIFQKELNRIAEEKEVIYLMGNHDDDTGLDELGFNSWSTRMQESLPKVKFYYSLALPRYNRNILIIHGHQYTGDDSTNTRLVVETFNKLQAILGSRFKLVYRTIDKLERIITGASKTIKRKAIAHAKLGKFDMVICGHAHTPEITVEDNCTYINTGHWLGNEGWYVEMIGGVPQLKSFL